jgi:hypothetical protein
MHYFKDKKMYRLIEQQHQESAKKAYGQTHVSGSPEDAAPAEKCDKHKDTFERKKSFGLLVGNITIIGAAPI